jgi:hypothetical protein
VRQAVASNFATPKEILQKLSGDSSYCVREAVAKHPKTSKCYARAAAKANLKAD